MTIADCIQKFAGDIDIDKLKSIAKAYTDNGMTPDTAIVKSAADENIRLKSELDTTLELAGVKKAKQPATQKAEIEPDQFTKQAAQSIIDADPNLKVVDENGNAMAAKDLLDQAETRFQQDVKEADLFKVAVACAIGVGE